MATPVWILTCVAIVLGAVFLVSIPIAACTVVAAAYTRLDEDERRSL